MADEPIKATLSEIADGAPIPFEVSGTPFAIRQPEPEEYDDAKSMYDLAYAKAMADPEMAALKETPCSDGQRENLLGLAAIAEQMAKVEGTTPEQRALWNERCVGLRKMAAEQTYAQELAHKRAVLVRDRWLTIRLLVDQYGHPVFDPKARDFRKKWSARGMQKIKEAARPAIWQALDLFENAPFLSDSQAEPNTG